MQQIREGESIVDFINRDTDRMVSLRTKERMKPSAEKYIKLITNLSRVIDEVRGEMNGTGN